MHTIILAAGQATRLAPLCNDIPKTLLAIDNKLILEHILDICQNCKLYSFSIVTGHGHKAVDDFVSNYLVERPDINIDIVYNEEYSSKGNIYSYYIAKHLFENDHIIINSDTIFHQNILEDLLAHPEKNVMAVDNFKELSDEEMKISLNSENKIHKIHKSINPEKSVGEYIGVMKLGKEHAPKVIEGMEKTMKEDDSLYYEDGLQKAIDMGMPMHMQSTKSLPAMEIDTHEDLADAKDLIKQVRA